MSNQSIYIKGMVCHRCEMVVEYICKDLMLREAGIEMGRVIFEKSLNDKQYEQFTLRLMNAGFSVVMNKKNQLIEQIKSEVITYIDRCLSLEGINMSEYLSSRTGYDYSYISGVFSRDQNMSIERYVIANKIERIKELMYVDKLNLSQISYELGYSSPAHMSTQFKRETGMSPGAYRQKYDMRSRVPLDEIKIM